MAADGIYYTSPARPVLRAVIKRKVVICGDYYMPCSRRGEGREGEEREGSLSRGGPCDIDAS